MNLTHEQIDKMEAGLEMDALIAEKVLGFTNVRILMAGSEGRRGKYGVHCFDCVMHGDEEVCDGYSTDIAAAWNLVEKMKADNPRFCLMWDSDYDWWRCGELENHYGDECWHQDGYSESAPLAICRAALKTLIK